MCTVTRAGEELLVYSAEVHPLLIHVSNRFQTGIPAGRGSQERCDAEMNQGAQGALVEGRTQLLGRALCTD